MKSTSIRVWLLPISAAFIIFLLLSGLQLFGPIIHLQGRSSTWGTLALAICIQAIPFLTLGVLVSGIISAFVPANFLANITPRSKILSVPAASLAGMALPGCECASVPVSASLMRRGVPPAAALAFLLAAPAVNPVVLVATYIAFPANKYMVWARLVASLIAVVATCWIWIACDKKSWMKEQKDSFEGENISKAEIFRSTVVNDFLQAGGFLVIGAACAALIKVTVPTSWFDLLMDRWWLGILVMALLAILLSLCSEADAFVVASFTSISPTAQLAFLVVGPMVDIKLFAMQTGAFGFKFASRFMPLALICCIISAAVVGKFFFGMF